MNLVMPTESAVKEVEEAEKRIEREQEATQYQARKLCACGKMFTPYRSFQRYCCDAHRVKYTKGKRTSYTKKAVEVKKCKQCGKDFSTNDGKRHYCSNECYLRYQLELRVEKERRVCFVCGQPFMSAHFSKRYCSEGCRKTARATRVASK
jgi:CDP-glycerol glycerophosphotransferase (TagB/SpsB family)